MANDGALFMFDDNQKYVEVEISWIKDNLERLSEALEKLAASVITEKTFWRMMEKVSVIEQDLAEQRKQLVKIESELKIMRGVGVFLAGILGTLVAAWLKMLLGV